MSQEPATASAAAAAPDSACLLVATASSSPLLFPPQRSSSSPSSPPCAKLIVAVNSAPSPLPALCTVRSPPIAMTMLRAAEGGEPVSGWSRDRRLPSTKCRHCAGARRTSSRCRARGPCRRSSPGQNPAGQYQHSGQGICGNTNKRCRGERPAVQERASACTKGWKSLSIPSAEIPTPVSDTRTRSRGGGGGGGTCPDRRELPPSAAAAAGGDTRSTVIVTLPPSGVNLIAFTRRLESTCGGQNDSHKEPR